MAQVYSLMKQTINERQVARASPTTLQTKISTRQQFLPNRHLLMVAALIFKSRVQDD